METVDTVTGVAEWMNKDPSGFIWWKEQEVDNPTSFRMLQKVHEISIFQVSIHCPFDFAHYPFDTQGYIVALMTNFVISNRKIMKMLPYWGNIFR